MKYRLPSLLACIPLALSSALAQTNLIIPEPSQIQTVDGNFELTAGTVIVAPKELTNEAHALRDLLAPATGFKLKVQSKKASGPQIKLVIDPKLDELGKEGYTLHVVGKGVVIKATQPVGVYYGVQSIIQMLPDEIVSSAKVDTSWTIPFAKVTDSPRFSWRAFMLDEARHFKGKTEVKKLLDQMAALKMNVFHWHLTDDQGWRIEIKKYPKLTSVGSKRKDTETGTWGSGTSTGEPHEGYYTQEEIKEIVAYAKARHITIVPEIGMPGHAMAAIAAYPELGTKKEQIEVWAKFGKAYHTYDPSDENTYRILGDVFDEIFELFPSKIVHIGGDEVRFDHWQESKSVQELMKREGLKTMADVQLYFTNRIAGIVQSKGRNIMGWNEIVGDDLHGFLQGGQTASAAKLDKDTVVHFWKGSAELAKKAIKKGHTIVNSWHSYTYLDYGYGSIPLSKAYNFNPVIGGLTAEEQTRIIGSGCQMWSEWIPKVSDLERQVFPRLAAYAEVGWTELENKNFTSFKERMKGQLKRWDIQGIAYAKNQVSKLSPSDFFNHVNIDSWNPSKAPSEFKKVSFSTDGKITDAGEYEVAFLYKSGAHALEISEVALLENGKKVAIDKHDGFSGHNLNGIAYKLKLEKYKPRATYTLRARIKGSGGTNSHGEVKLKAAE